MCVCGHAKGSHGEHHEVMYGCQYCSCKKYKE